MKSSQTAMESYFGEAVFTYTDADALEDGAIADISGMCLDVRSHTFDPKTKRFIDGELMRVNRATQALLLKVFPENDDEAELALELDTLSDYLVAIVQRGLEDSEGDGQLLTGKLPDGSAVWFVRNEVGGLTAMLPSDY